MNPQYRKERKEMEERSKIDLGSDYPKPKASKPPERPKGPHKTGNHGPK